MVVRTGMRPTRTPSDDAFDELYRAHRAGLVRLAYLLLHDAALAEDVAHDALVATYRRWSHLEDPAKALTYVRAAVVNGSRSALRRRVVARRHLVDVTSRVASEQGRTTRDGGESPTLLAPSAEISVLAEEQRREVLVALAAIAPRQREVLVLRYWLDLSEAEIATTLRISAGSVKSAASRGLDALQQRLGELR